MEHTFDKHSIDLEPGNPVRADLASLLVGNRTEPVYVCSLEACLCEKNIFYLHSYILQMVSCLFPRYVPNLFPNYIRAPNGAEAKPVSQLYKGQSSLSSC